MQTAIQSQTIGEIQAHLAELSVDLGQELADELLDLFLDDSLPRLEILTGAVLSSDRVVAQREAHSLKGAAGNLGAMSLWNLCASLEREIGSGDWPQARDDAFELRQRLNEVLRHFSRRAS